MTKDRQLRKKDAIRKTILDAARNIISQEGIPGLSIRKVTNAIGYSPAIIYHYFKDKNEIVETLVNEGFGRILASVGSVERNEREPEKEIKEVFTKYIKMSLEFSEEYKSVMLSDDPAVLQKTGLLEEGISNKSPTMQRLCETLERGIAKGNFTATINPELTAQIIWTATFGLIIKLIVEKNVPQAQLERLIDHHFELMFKGLLKREED